MISHGFIFARGGSKGLPRKNIKSLAGKPLICYSIETALKSKFIDKVFVSTDDQEIASIAEKSGAIIIMRPLELAGDKSPEWLAWRHAVEWVTGKYGHFDEFISLPATSPLRSVADVDSAVDKRRTENADICISVTPSNRSPYFNMVKITADQMVELVNKPELNVYRRQDAPEVFDITTVVYAASCTFVMEKNGLFEGRVTSIEIPKNRAVDIDDIYDFKLAEAILMDEKNNAK